MARAPVKSFLILTLLSWSLAGCAGYGPEMRRLDVGDRSAGDVWREIVRFGATRGLRPDQGATDAGLRVYQSQWVGQSAPLFRSRRWRLRAEIDPLEEIAGWCVLYHVEVQTVEDLNRMMRAREEDWVPAGQDATREQEFARVLRIGLHLDASSATAEKASAGSGAVP